MGFFEKSLIFILNPPFIIANAPNGVPSPLPHPLLKNEAPAPPQLKTKSLAIEKSETCFTHKATLEKGGGNSNKNVIFSLRSFKVSKERNNLLENILLD